MVYEVLVLAERKIVRYRGLPADTLFSGNYYHFNSRI